VKITITNEGYLRLERAGRLRDQRCTHNGQRCGDWCPLFGEPGLECPDGQRGLEICQGRLLRGEITDERGAK
jgi:hypothetical protein